MTNWYTQNEYDTNSDFADWDDFFESKPLHDLEDILEDYSVVLSYSDSRFFGTIVESNASLDGLSLLMITMHSGTNILM